MANPSPMPPDQPAESPQNAIPPWYVDIHGEDDPQIEKIEIRETIMPPPVVRKDGDDPLALAQYLKDDLMALLQHNPYKKPLDPIAWLNLFRLKGEYPLHKESIIELIADDLGMMMRDQLIASFHVIFAQPVPDASPFGFHFVNAYHARYLAMEPEYGQTVQAGPLKESGDLPSPEIVAACQFMIAVTWIPGLTANRKSSVRRHRLLFDWVAFDGIEALMTMMRVMRGQINPNLAEPVEPKYAPDPPITT